MDKKNYIWLGVGAVVVIAVIYLLVSGSNPKTDVNGQPKADGSAKTGIIPNGGNQAPSIAANTPIKPTDGAPLKENIITVDGTDFSPKNIDAAQGSKVFMTFSARDAKTHTFAFEPEDLAFITVSFSKAEGDKSITFVAPAAGTYSFYLDKKDNKGTLTVK
jgi:plastocyanin